MTTEELDAIERESAADLAAVADRPYLQCGCELAAHGCRERPACDCRCHRGLLSDADDHEPYCAYFAVDRSECGRHSDYARRMTAATQRHHAATMALVAAHREALARIEELTTELRHANARTVSVSMAVETELRAQIESAFRAAYDTGWWEAAIEGAVSAQKDQDAAWERYKARAALQRDGGEAQP